MDFEIDLGAKLELTTDAINTGFEKLSKQSMGKPSLGRRSVTLFGTGALPVQNVVISGPGAGYVWNLDSIVTYGADDHTLYNPTPGTPFVGAVYLGTVSSYGLGSLCLPGLSFPDAVDFPDGQWVRHGEDIVLVVSATLALNQQLGMNIWYRQYIEAEITEMSGR